MEEEIRKIFKKYNLQLSDMMLKQLKEYYSYLIEENSKFNLTSITEFDDVIKKHFLDSIFPEFLIPKNSKIVDIGSGAGFPGVPLKIYRPDLDVVLVDSLQKRINFLKNLISRLFLNKISAIHMRAEDFAKNNFECFDVAISRAVAKTNTLAEYLLPLVKIGGCALFLKSQDIEDELKDAEKAIKTLGGKLEKVETYEIYGNKRSVLVVKKVKNTPKIYPRAKNLPKTKPIF